MFCRLLDSCKNPSSGSVISGSNLTVTNSWLIEHACNDPQGSTEREEYIVGEQYREGKRSKREDLELHMRSSSHAVPFYVVHFH